MDKLTLSDLCILIHVLEKELDHIYRSINSEDENVSNDASELSIPYGSAASKLETIYKSLWSEDDNYPSYEELIKRA